MNKKRLSVVMAGAMLATSVAPVLAAETTGTEIAFENKATLKADILAKMSGKKVSDYAIFKTAGIVDSNIAKEIAGNTGTVSSKYGVKITKKDGTVVKTTYKASEVETALENLVAGDKVEVYERATVDFYGQTLPGAKTPTASSLISKYTDGDDGDFDSNGGELTTTQNEIKVLSSDNKLVDKVAGGVDAAATKLTVTLNKLTDIKDDSSNEIIELTKDNNKIDGRLAFDKEGKLLDVTKNEDVQKFHHFGDLVEWNEATEDPEKRDEKVIETYTLGEKPVDETKETLKVSDLYDGIALTARGTEILADYNNAKEAAKEAGVADAKAAVRIGNVVDNTSTTGLATFTVTYYSNANTDTVEKEITIISNSKDNKEATALHDLLVSGIFKVGIVAGQNRYETAVNVAKTQNIISLDGTANKANIVLVNGESLVDGLAAAPLAAEKNAPLLLSEADKLPTATREYIESLVSELGATAKKKITVNLVGGKTVLSNSLVNEIEEMGLKVERVGGSNREATSVAVANKLTTKDEAFVVGANGEADAMSISAVAAKKKAPIIVSKVGGLSTDAVEFLRNNSDDITIVGGESVVSKEEENKINENIPGVKATRIAGKNRIETNNAIIKAYYGTTKAKGVIVVKDGIAKKSELIDALSAANYAATNDAAIVLATKEVTDAQKATLLEVKDTTSNNFDLLAQVGMGAERTVLETLASVLNISNK